MVAYYACVIFLFGACFGSFYNVVGYRLPRNMSIIRPNSHCTTCKHELNVLDLFPIFSYIFLKGKCRYCGSKVGLFYPTFELITGLLFMFSYLKFGFSYEFLIAIIFISMALIVIISDFGTMIIPDEVLVVSSILIIIVNLIFFGLKHTGFILINGLIAFLCMYLLKLFGDFLFKKESMGGGDIKMMTYVALIIGWKLSIVVIFLASFLALPLSIINMYKNNEHMLPFGPYLGLSSLIIFLCKIDMPFIISLLTK